MMIKLSLFILLGSGLNAVAQSPGTFVAAGSMTTVRSLYHTATLLKDGRVLIAGGVGGGGTAVLANAELYDPSTGAFTATSSLAAPRWGHPAALLPAGRVLIVGGTSSELEEDYPVYATTAELYDPAIGTFTAIRHDAGVAGAANLLSNGKVLITGGESAEFYDPQTGIFTPAGPANGGSVALLKDGRVLILKYNGVVSLYDVTSEGLKLIGNSLIKSGSSESTTLGNGKVLISGGFGGQGVFTGEASLYDPRSRTLENTGFLVVSRGWHTATLLPGGRVLLAGGVTGTFGPGSSILKSAELYDPVTRSFISTGSMTFARGLQTATLLHDGRVLIVGGGRLGAELYIPELRAASAASLSGSLAPESLASLFGSRLAVSTESADPLSPPTSLGGTSLRLRDSSGAAVLAPLLYVSPSQINFEVPAGIAPGNISLEVVNAPTQLSQVAAQVERVAPGLFAYEDNTAAAYALRVEPDGKQTVLSVRSTIVLDDRPVYLIAYATGIRNRSSLANARTTIGGISVPVEYAGPEGSGVPGLDQVNVRLTPALKGLGVANLVLSVDGVSSNTVSVEIR